MQMNKFLRDILILIVPLVIWSAFVLLADPFNYFDLPSLFTRDIKEKNSKNVNEILYNVIQYTRNPGDNLLIGDSRINYWPKNEIEQISGEKYSKLVIPSAKLNEILDLIYLAETKTKLKQVTVGINFTMLNEYAYADRIRNVKEILSNPLKYLFNRNIAQAIYYDLKAYFSGKNVETIPPMSREEWWKFYVKTKSFEWYGKYKYSDKLINELIELDRFAAKNNIRLTFIVVPLNTEFRNKLTEYGLSENEKEFKASLGKLNSKVIDFDYQNEVTDNKDNFVDPIHVNTSIGHLIVNEVWKDSLVLGRRLR
jgi:hypothetical protein